MLFGYKVEEFKALTEVFLKVIPVLLDLQPHSTALFLCAIFLPENLKALKEIKRSGCDVIVDEWQLP